MVVVVSRFRVANGLEPAVEQAFLQRPRLVDDDPGFLGLEVLLDSNDRSQFYLVTRWCDEECYRKWHSSEAHRESHLGIPKGLKLDARFTSVLSLNRLTGAGEPDVEPAILASLPTICSYLENSTAVHLLSASTDGTLLFLNHAFASRLGSGLRASRVWEILTAEDEGHLRTRIAEGRRHSGPFLLNFVDSRMAPFTLRCRLDVHAQGFLLVGEPDFPQEMSLQHDLLEMNNQLAVLSRENARQNKELRATSQELEAELVRRRHAEEALRRSNRDLEQLAAIISHDLNSPLNALISCVSLLREEIECPPGSEAAKYLGYIEKSAAGARAMVLALLEYSRFTEERPLPPQTVESRAALERAVASLRTEIEGAGATITHDALPPVRADRVHLARVFQNLLQNAIKYRSERAPAIHVTARIEGAYCIFAVADNGIGIEQKHRESVFDLFWRADAERAPGLGIGLAACKRIVQRHGGRIWVESTPGTGSTFFFSMPAAEDAPASVSANAG